MVLCCLTPALSQPQEAARRPSARRPSIHQIEWEKHRDETFKSQLPKFHGKPAPLTPGTAAPDKEIFGYLPYWQFDNFPTLNYDLLTTIAYFGAEINAQGGFVALHDWPAAALIDRAHSEGVRVVLTVILFDGEAIRSLLTSASRRATLISNLLQQVGNAGADGVNIDFEGVPGGLRSDLTRFMTELTEAFHASLPGSFVTIFTPAVDWSNVYDYSELAQVTDGLVMQGYDYHWSTAPTAGPVAPLTGDRWGFFNVSWTVNDYLVKTDDNTSKLMLGVPFYGFDWPTDDDSFESMVTGPFKTILFSAAPDNAALYGRLWDEESQTPWYKYQDGSQWHQGWYDDSLSLSKKFDLVNSVGLKGIAIWALGFDGQRLELQGALSDAFGSTAPPLQPATFRLLAAGEGELEVATAPASGATSYRVYQSPDGVGFDNGTDFPNTANIIGNLNANAAHYFKVSAVNGNGESSLTQVLAAMPAADPPDVLIVDGFDRTAGTVNTFDFVKRYGPALQKLGRPFDSCSNEAVESGAVVLTDYSTVFWISGEEATANQSFSSVERAQVAAFLEEGGNLFISGSEIGFDLSGQGTTSERNFYATYFKAQYIRDRVSSHSIAGIPDGIFKDAGTVAFDDGSHGTYDVDWPDGILPVGGALLNLQYSGFDPQTFGGAGVQYEGTFGTSEISAKLVYLAIPFETIYPESSRDQIITAALDFFGGLPTDVSQGPGPAVPESFALEQNYPNPFNPTTTISFSLRNTAPARLKLTILNVLGQHIATLIDEPRSFGHYSVVWNGRDEQGLALPSGVYLYRLQVGTGTVLTKKMTLLK